MAIEQRRHSRFLVRDQVIAALQNGFTRIGTVKDISSSGLAFEHILEEISAPDPLEKQLYLFTDQFSFLPIRCRVVYDIPVSMSDEDGPFFIHFMTRRCGIAFEELSEDQKIELDLFLKTHTIGNMS